MKAYLVTTGLVFALIIGAHIARLFAEGVQLAKEPVFVLTTILSVAMAAWAWRLLLRLPRG